MGFEEKQRGRGGKFGEVNDFHGRDFQINTKPSQRLIAGNGNKNSGGKKSREPDGSLHSLFYFMMTSFIKKSEALSSSSLSYQNSLPSAVTSWPSVKDSACSGDRSRVAVEVRPL